MKAQSGEGERPLMALREFNDVVVGERVLRQFEPLEMVRGQVIELGRMQHACRAFAMRWYCKKLLLGASASTYWARMR
ncbi:MAG: hypothetical protein NTX51_10020 [Verrucomicrobia bacterium]|nr:hypothetical protein [Verrucomicrobiota bacterium]